MTKGTNVCESILLYLKLYFKNERMVDFDLPCYIKKDNLEKYSEIIKKVKDENLSIVSHDYYHDKIVKILDPLTLTLHRLPYLPNDPEEHGERSPIYWAARNGHTEIVKILAPLADNPNAPYTDGRNPIYCAARYGHTEIIKILAPLADNPNTPNINGSTPIHWAACCGH